MVSQVNQATIIQSYKRIQNEIRLTPTIKIGQTSQQLPQKSDIYLKLEQLQVTGSFKIRGVTNKILNSSAEHLKKGLVTASGGNHGRAVAYAGWKKQLPTTVYLPETTPTEKIELIRAFKAETIIAGKDLDEANQIAAEEALKCNKLLIHPYADADVINGQGTIAVELLEQIPDLTTIILAIGGGGLISGVGTYMKAINPNIRIIGVEPKGCPTLYESLKQGHIVPVEHIQTKLGTLAIRCTSQLNFELAKKCVDEIILVEDQDTLDASQWLWKEYGITAEMSGSASLAGLLSGKVRVDPSERVCCLICGLGKDGIL